jgi:uridine kinase
MQTRSYNANWYYHVKRNYKHQIKTTSSHADINAANGKNHEVIEYNYFVGLLLLSFGEVVHR